MVGVAREGNEDIEEGQAGSWRTYNWVMGLSLTTEVRQQILKSDVSL